MTPWGVLPPVPNHRTETTAMNAPAPRHDRPLFALGRCQITPDAAALMQEHAASVQDLLWRHQTGDWSRHDPTDPTRAGIPDW